MTLPQAYEIFEFWADWPPENESVAMLLASLTDWQPAARRNMTEEEKTVEHRKSLERRWKSGQYMNVKQMFEATGGVMRVGPGADQPMGGIGPFPGNH